MIKTILNIAFILTFLTSCCSRNSKEKNSIKTAKLNVDTLIVDDYKIINSTFVHLVNPAPEGVERKFGYNNYEKKNQTIPPELVKKLYFVSYLMCTNDTVGFKSKIDINNDKLLEINDKEFQSIASKLIFNCPKTKKLDINKITNVGLYKLGEIEPNENPRLEIGDKIISFSRIVYNENRSKACFYFEKYCAGLCGYGAIILMEKENDIWKIRHEIIDWIS